MFLFQFVKHIIETVIEIYEILLIWCLDPQYPWSQGIGSPIWGSSMTRVNVPQSIALLSRYFNMLDHMYASDSNGSTNLYLALLILRLILSKAQERKDF